MERLVCRCRQTLGPTWGPKAWKDNGTRSNESMSNERSKLVGKMKASESVDGKVKVNEIVIIQLEPEKIMPGMMVMMMYWMLFLIYPLKEFDDKLL